MNKLKSTSFLRGALVPVMVLLAGASQSFGVTFTGFTAGTFNNAVGDPGMVTTGLGTSSFTWGANDASIGVPPPPNSLDFSQIFFIGFRPDTSIPLGSVTYFNGTTLLGTNATNVDLDVDVTFTSPVGLVTLNLLLDLITTPNIPGPVDDYISLPEVPSQVFTLDGIKYRFDVSFNGEREFFVPEGQSATTELLGTITTLPVPESGSSLALLGGGMLLISGLRRKLKATK